jgi:regulator of protease activity HflC (stomatin/prohibitin superfamily)
MKDKERKQMPGRREYTAESDGPPVKLIGSIIIFILGFCVFGIFAKIVIHRVDPGFVGVVVDYGKGSQAGKPSIKEAPTGTFLFLNPVTQRVAQYPIAQQTLSMLRSTHEGKVTGDDSVQCQDRNGIQINQDVSILWRVDPTQVGELYLQRPGVDLVGKDGGDIEDLIVRREARNAVNFACSNFTYDELYGGSKPAFSQKATDILATNLKDSHIIVDKVSLGETYLGDAQRTALENKAKAQQDAQTASFLKQKAENEAAAGVAKADGDKQIAIKAAEAQAASIKLINDQLASSPNYIQWLYANNWDGHMPTTVVNGGGTPLVTIPGPTSIPGPSPAPSPSPAPAPSPQPSAKP